MNKILRIESNISNLRIVEKVLDEFSQELEMKEDCYGKVMVCTMEAVNNAIVHGNKLNENKFVEIELNYNRKKLKISVTDEGTGFIPGEIPDPTKTENIEKLSGRGVFLMSKLADKIEFNESGNKVIMLFKDIRT